MKPDEILQLCDEAERLLDIHAADVKIAGYARTLAQCEFARLGYPLLALAVKYLREISSTNISYSYICAACSEIVPLPDLSEAADLLDSGTTLHCPSCGGETVVDLDAPETRAARYAASEDAARWRGLLETAVNNAEDFRDLFIASERKVVELEAKLRLARGKATSRGGRL